MNLQEHLFQQLQEEACETAVAASKCNRFTLDHTYYETSNLERLRVEIRDQMSVLRVIELELGITFDTSPCDEKIARVYDTMALSRKMETLK